MDNVFAFEFEKALAYGAGKRDERESIINYLERKMEDGTIPGHVIAVLSKNPETGACPTCGYDCPE